MTNIEPHVEIYDVENVPATSYGNAGKIALIGAFPTNTFKLDLFTDVEEAKKALGGEYVQNNMLHRIRDTVPTDYISYYCLDYIFYSNKNAPGAESVVIVNTNYEKSELTPIITNQDIANACVLLADEDFDILTIGDNIPFVVDDALNPVLYTLKSFNDSQYLSQHPFGIITGLDMENATPAILTAFRELYEDKGFFKAVTTPIRFKGDAQALDIAKSGCWHSAYTAGQTVNKSETAKIYPELVGLNSKEMYPLSGTVNYNQLRENGFHTTRYRNRRLSLLECLSNITPAGYDMKIERVKNYLIKRLALVDTLGDDNTHVTRDFLKGMFEHEKQLAIDAGYLLDMDYKLSVVDSETLLAEIVLYIPDIIRKIVLNVELKITAYDEEE